MRVAIACVACLLQLVRGLVSDQDRCTGPEAQARLWSFVRAFKANRSDLKLLEEDGCLGEEELYEIEQDPDDAVEYLGTESGDNDERLMWPRGFCKRPRRPTMLYIGVGHSGSTTLSMHLDSHPQMSYGRKKEHDFWKAGRGKDTKTFSDYLSEFRVPCRTKVVMDFPVRVYEQSMPEFDKVLGHWYGGVEKATPLGEPYLRRFRELMGPNLKLVFMFRNPVDYLASFQINGTRMLERMEAGEKDIPDRNKMLKVRYATALEPWLRLYPRENFLFLKSEDFFADPQSTLDKIFNFTHVAPSRYSAEALRRHSGRRRAVGKELLTDKDRYAFYQHEEPRRELQKLQELTGLDLADWLPH